MTTRVKHKRGVYANSMTMHQARMQEAARMAFAREGLKTVTITAIDNGKHGLRGGRTIHGTGNAVDIRTGHSWLVPLMSKATAERIVRRMKEYLGSDFDVVLEGPKAPHIHAEYDPKVPIV